MMQGIILLFLDGRKKGDLENRKNTIKKKQIFSVRALEQLFTKKLCLMKSVILMNNFSLILRMWISVIVLGFMVMKTGTVQMPFVFMWGAGLPEVDIIPLKSKYPPETTYIWFIKICL